VRWTLAYGRWLWLLAVALAVPSTVALIRLYANLTSEVEELLPRNAASVSAVEELRQRLPGLSALGVVVATSNPSELPAAERLVDDLAARVRAYPPALVRAVKTGTEAAAERRFLSEHLPLFVELGDLVEIRKRVEARRSWDTRRRLGIAFDETAPPPLDFSDIEAKYQARFPGVRLPTSAANDGGPPPTRYTDRQAGVTLLLIEGTESSLGAHHAGRLLARVKEDIRALGGPRHYAPGLRVGYAGNIAVSVEELSALSADLGKSSVLVVIAVLLVIFLYFRWWAALPLLFVPLTIATVLSFGLVTLPPFRVDRLNSSTGFLGSIVVGNGINYGVIWLARYVAGRRRGQPLEAALAEATWGALPGTLVAAAAAATAYASLTITGFRGFRQFGTIGAVGMIACWAATYLLAPSLCAAIERLTGRGPPPLAREDAPGRQITARLLQSVFRRPRAVVAVAGVATLIALAQVVTLNSSHLESDFSKLRRRDTWTSGEGYWGRLMDRIIGGNLSPTVILTDSAAEASAVAAGLRAESAHPPLGTLVANVRSLDDAVPPDQPAKIEEVARLRRQLTPAVRASLPPERLAEIDRLLGSESLRPIGLADLPTSLTAGLREKDGTLGRVVLVFPRLTKRLWQTAQLEGFIAKLRDVAAHAVPPGSRPGRVAGTLPVSADITASLQRDAPRSSLLALLSVSAVVAVIFRGSRTGAVVIASLLVGIVWMIGATFLCGIKVNYANFAAFPITFGIGVDYAVNIMARFRQERARRAGDALPEDPARAVERAVLSTGGAVALCSLTTIIGYSSLLLAKNQALFLFGAVAVMGELGCLFAALLALPAALLVWRRLTAGLMGGAQTAVTRARTGETIEAEALRRDAARARGHDPLRPDRSPGGGV
jgi:predicted RND superfamily exporter protein